MAQELTKQELLEQLGKHDIATLALLVHMLRGIGKGRSGKFVATVSGARLTDITPLGAKIGALELETEWRERRETTHGSRPQTELVATRTTHVTSEGRTRLDGS